MSPPSLTLILSTLCLGLSGTSCRPQTPHSGPVSPAVAAIPDDRTAPPTEADYALLGWHDTRYTLNGLPFSGLGVKKYPSGEREMVIELIDGIPHGWTREWYAGGAKKVETAFRNGLRHGSNTYWLPDGRMQKHQTYERGQVTHEEHGAQLPAR
jgi:hypothetical protein